MSDKIDRVAKAMGKLDEFYIEFEEKCYKCGKQYLGLELTVKIPEQIPLCNDCLPKDIDLSEWCVGIVVGEIDE